MNTFSTSPQSTGSDSLAHMEALYAMAQVLTLDAEKATQLLEKTYRQAMDTAGQRTAILQDRRYMMQLLIRIHQEQSAPPAEDTALSPAGQSSQTQDSFKQRILDQFLNESAPVAFATLNDSDRILLTLCDVENMSCADAALILGATPADTCSKLDEVRKTFEEVIKGNASPAEAQLLQQLNASDWIGNALRKALNSEFAASPPTLGPRLKSTLASAYPAVIGAERQRLEVKRDRGPVEQTSSRRFSRGLSTLLLILTAGMAGYIGSALLRNTPESNLIALSVNKADRVETILQTSDALAAERFVRNQMNWRLSLPVISQSTLTGVGISEIADNVRVPVFLYKDELDHRNEVITVYAYTYALLDQFADRIDLERDILTAISSQDHFDIHDLNDRQKVIIWRNANEIFMAVTSNDARELRQRIVQP